MEDLIKALQIFLKYDNPYNPTHCEHDCLHVMIDPSVVSEEDIASLEELGFDVGDDNFTSFRYGSA